MRVAVVTESFLPQVNGVTNSVLRVCEHLQSEGHEVVVIAPGSGPNEWAGARVVRTPSLPLPGYADFRLARPWGGMTTTLRQFRPDVVHLASPTILGAQAAFAAHRIGLPMVAVYQTDLAGFAARYGLRRAERIVWSWLRRVHGMAGRTLAPSLSAAEDLRRNGVLRVARWARGVDLQRFHPKHRDAALHARLAPDGELLVGYVGRLAHEKQVELLALLDRHPGIRLVVVGDGPQRAHLQRQLPRASFLGFQGGDQLAATFASLDVFVHPGAHETFCQAAQEALASGVPVVGPSAGGLRDLVEPGRTGAWFAPGSATSLCAQVATLAADTPGRLTMAAAARSSVAGRGWDVIGQELIQHYREVSTA
jgi:phosphatidylinositol alpha 1,6-mannosyltransferase